MISSRTQERRLRRRCIGLHLKYSFRARRLRAKGYSEEEFDNKTKNFKERRDLLVNELREYDTKQGEPREQ